MSIAVSGFVNSETKYVGKLKLLVESLGRMKPRNGVGILSEEETSEIYRNIKILYKASNRFMTVLRESEGPEKVGPIISWYFGSAGFARNYVEYAKFHARALRFLDHAMLRPNVAAEIRKVKMGFNSNDIRSSVEVFEEPIKRIIEYTKILEHVDREFQGDKDVKEGIRSLKAVLRKMDQAIKDTDEIYMEEVIEYLKEYGVFLEKFNYGVPLKLLSTKTIPTRLKGENSPTTRECFLFNDHLVIVNPPEAVVISGYSNKFVTVLTPHSRYWDIEIAEGVECSVISLDNEAAALMWLTTLSKMAKKAAEKMPEPAGPPPELEPEVEEGPSAEESAAAIKFRVDSVKALLQSELKFLAEMDRVETTFLIPLKERAVIDEVQREVLFANFNEVYTIHKAFADDLQARLDEAEQNNSDINLGDSLLVFLPQLSGVCVEHANLFGALEKIVDSIKSQSATMEFFHNDDELELITGYQFNQLNDVNELIVDIVQNTSQDHYENASLSMSSDIIGAINKEIEARIESSRSAVGAARNRASSAVDASDPSEKGPAPVEPSSKKSPAPSSSSAAAARAAAKENSEWLVAFLKQSVPAAQVKSICAKSGIVLKEPVKEATPIPKLLPVEKMAFNKFASGAQTFMDNQACETCREKTSFIRWKTCCSVCKKHVCSSCAGLYSLTSAKERGCQHQNTRSGKKSEFHRASIPV